MLIPRSWLKRYSDAINVVSEQGKAELVRLLAEVDFSRDVATVRNEVIAIMQACCGASSTVAARLAADFYDGIRAEFGLADGFEAVVDSGRVPEATSGAVRAFVQDIVDEKPIEQFVEKCVNRLDHETRLAANKCVERNTRFDPAKPKWARIPMGAETCEFCIMLASRGFVYGNEDLASHAHANCDCRVVPSWDRSKAAAEGYDPDAYYEQWQEMRRR